MTSRERVIAAINHIQPDRVPVDFGATGQTGISASVVYRLRKALSLPEHPVTVQEIFQMLGVVEEDLRQALTGDVVGLWGTHDMFGCKIEGGKPFFATDGTPLTVSEKFEYDMVGEDCYAYPSGNRSAAPCAVMPKSSCFFDGIFRGEGFDEDCLTPAEDFREDFAVMSDEDAKQYEKESKRLFKETQYAVIGNLGGAGLGDVALLPSLTGAHPKGIRKIEDWLMAHLLYPEYIEEVFEMQTQVMLKNLELYRQAVGDRIQMIWISGTDFGTQNGEFVSLESFRRLYKPFYTRINDWVHKHTPWKTFYHTCGSIRKLLPDLVEMGVDIVNPVQVSAKNMDAQELKAEFGKKLVFWGGGVDTQRTLPFGSAEEVYRQVQDRLRIFGQGGGYVFSSIHNIVAKTPVENLLSMLKAVKDYNKM